MSAKNTAREELSTPLKPNAGQALRRLGIAVLAVCLPVSVCINIYQAMQVHELRNVNAQNAALNDGYENLRQVTLRMVMQLEPMAHDDPKVGAMLEEFRPVLEPHGVWPGTMPPSTR